MVTPVRFHPDCKHAILTTLMPDETSTPRSYRPAEYALRLEGTDGRPVEDFTLEINPITDSEAGVILDFIRVDGTTLHIDHDAAPGAATTVELVARAPDGGEATNRITIIKERIERAEDVTFEPVASNTRDGGYAIEEMRIFTPAHEPGYFVRHAPPWVQRAVQERPTEVTDSPEKGRSGAYLFGRVTPKIRGDRDPTVPRSRA